MADTWIENYFEGCGKHMQQQDDETYHGWTDYLKWRIEMSNCELCGEPMPPGEEMFKFHGYSGPCPKPPKPRKEPLSEVQECLVEQVRLTDVEKKRRIYYQDIVYNVCSSLDRIFAKRISRGEGTVCGTFEMPTTEVQDAMKEVEARCEEWARIKFENQIPQMPLPKESP